jgi:polar amino acid transport system substrate-binding protein
MPPSSRWRTADGRWQVANSKGFAIRYRLDAIRLPVGTLPIVLLVLILLTYWAWVSFTPKPPAKPDPTWTRIVTEGVLRIGIDPSFPPFETDDGKGNLSGLDIALAKEFVQDWSKETVTPTIRVEYVYTGYDGLYDALNAGQFDAILSALPYNPQKTEDVLFSHSYFNGGPFIVVHAGDAKTRTFSDLANERVGVELGSSGDAFARKWERRLKFDLREFDTAVDALHTLQGNGIDAVFTDAITFDEFSKTASGLKSVGDPLSDDLYVIAVRKDEPTLLGQINAEIDAMKRDGRMETLQKEWF